jgi:Protein of unknown function (DUF1615)
MAKSQLAFCLSMVLTATSASAVDISISETARLIRKAEKVPDSQGWAADMHDVLRQHDLEPSRENVCAAIAIIDQESGFVADPAVPGLGKLSETALREKFGRIPIAGSIALRWLEQTPSSGDSYMSRIRNAKTERDLDLAYRRFVDDMSSRASMGAIVNSGLLNKIIEDRNEIETAGSMQVSVKFAIKAANRKRWLPMTLADAYAVRDQLYTRAGGMYYGIKQLLDFETGYNRKIFRFADYNAGRYASRNAAFQNIVSELSKTSLARDGDLLLYDRDAASARVSATERALRDVSKKFGLKLGKAEIRNDLLKGNELEFAATPTFLRIRNLYREETGKEAPYALLPDIDLSSPKITRHMTTASFATSVNRRYQACLANR